LGGFRFNSGVRTPCRGNEFAPRFCQPLSAFSADFNVTIPDAPPRGATWLGITEKNGALDVWQVTGVTLRRPLAAVVGVGGGGFCDSLRQPEIECFCGTRGVIGQREVPL
jgi:hypothetical protein